MGAPCKLHAHLCTCRIHPRYQKRRTFAQQLQSILRPQMIVRHRKLQSGGLTALLPVTSTMGGSGQTVTLPSGREVRAYNGDRGFFVRGRHTLKCLEGWKQYLPWKYVEFSDTLSVGKQECDAPSTLGVSKKHITLIGNGTARSAMRAQLNLSRRTASSMQDISMSPS